jgi:hypothetical protein
VDDLGALAGRVADQREEGGDRDREAGGDERGGEPARQQAQAPAEERVDDEAGPREQRQEPDQAGRAGR